MKHASRETAVATIHKDKYIYENCRANINIIKYSRNAFYLQKLYSLMVYISIISKLCLNYVMGDEIQLPVEEFLAESVAIESMHTCLVRSI